MKERGDVMEENSAVIYPSIRQATVSYLIVLLLLLLGSIFLLDIVGIGGILWVNELIIILIPPLLLAKINNWDKKQVFRLQKKVDLRTIFFTSIGIIGIWIFCNFITIVSENYLSQNLGNLVANEYLTSIPTPFQIFCAIIGMIVLAPICEEIFFRGFMQRAFESYNPKLSWIITGIFFGALHIPKGISHFIPITILGLIIGFTVYKIGSVKLAMLMHAVFNTCPLFLGDRFLRYMSLDSFPVDFCIVAFFSLGIGIWAIRYITKNSYLPAEEITVEAKSINSKIVPLRKNVSIWISLIILLSIIGLEIGVRVNDEKFLSTVLEHENNSIIDQYSDEEFYLDNKFDGKNSLKIGRLTGELEIMQVDISEENLQEITELVFRYSLSGDELDIVLSFTAPDGAIILEKEWKGSGLTVNYSKEKIKLTSPGEWTITIIGSAVNLEIEAEWVVK